MAVASFCTTFTAFYGLSGTLCSVLATTCFARVFSAIPSYGTAVEHAPILCMDVTQILDYSETYLMIK